MTFKGKLIDAGCAFVLAFFGMFLFILIKLRILKNGIYQAPWLYEFAMKLFYGSFYRPRNSILLKAISAQPGSAVLEVGCGTGKLAAQVRCKRYVGTDADNAMVKAARVNALGKEFKCLTAENVHFKECFDRVIIQDVLHHVQDPAYILNNAHGALRKDGLIIIWDAFDSGKEDVFSPLMAELAAVFDHTENNGKRWKTKPQLKQFLGSIRGTRLLRFEEMPHRNALAVLKKV